jgi:hypothetical protein
LLTPGIRTEKGTCQVRRIRRSIRRVSLGAADPSLTPRAGLYLVAELERVLGIVAAIDAEVGRTTARRRGLSAGALVVSMAETMLAGGDFMIDLDHQRRDEAGRPLRALGEIPASTTFIGRAKRFGAAVFSGIERANAALVRRWWDLLPEPRRAKLSSTRPTIDLDPTDVEVYGAAKEGVGFNYQGQRVGRPHPAVWAEAGVVLCADLGSGSSDPRPQARSLIRRAVTALPKGLPRPIVRVDSGFFSSDVAFAALCYGADFAIAAKRNPAAWRACRAIEQGAWRQAKDMEAEVAFCDYFPHGWPEGTRCVVRRVPVRPEELSFDPRSRRRRTIDPAQLSLLEDGEIGVAYAYSFILTNLEKDATEIESWFRMRALVEEKIKDAKLGAALRHLPSGYESVNHTWMWSAFLALNCSTFLQALCGLDTGPDGRAHGKRLRRELVMIPARVLRHAGGLVVRVAPEHRSGVFADAWARMHAMASFAGP